jgi:hypothetical protein
MLILISFYRKDGNTFTHAYHYSYCNTGNLTVKTNIVAGQATSVSISYDGNRARVGTIAGDSAFSNFYDNNGNRTRKRHFSGETLNYDYRYLYNLENKMSQVLDLQSGHTVRVSDQFYHLDGSRMWEGTLDESQSGNYYEGYFTWNQYLGFRLEPVPRLPPLVHRPRLPIQNAPPLRQRPSNRLVGMGTRKLGTVTYFGR